MKTKYIILAIVVPISVILDQVTKILAKTNLKPLRLELAYEDRYVTVIDGFFRLKYTENPGAAWGFGSSWSPEFRITFFILVSLVAIGMILWFFHKLEPKQRLLATAFALVLGGAVGNLIDRIYMNRVVDFIDWYITFDEPWNLLLFTASAGEHHWPTFNIADVAISCGVGLLIVDMLFGKKIAKWQESKTKESQAVEG